MIEFIKTLLRSNPVRFVSYATAASVWLVVKGSELAGVPLAADSDVALAVATIVGFLVTEIIRRLVYSPKTVSEILTQTTTTTADAAAAQVLSGAPPAVQPADLPGGSNQ
jgi:hypothetical protein